jgi:hypothetical protein
MSQMNGFQFITNKKMGLIVFSFFSGGLVSAVIVVVVIVVCLGVEQHCIWYYQEHPWYSNLYTNRYDKLEHKIQMEHDNRYVDLNGGLNSGD